MSNQSTAYRKFRRETAQWRKLEKCENFFAVKAETGNTKHFGKTNFFQRLRVKYM